MLGIAVASIQHLRAEKGLFPEGRLLEQNLSGFHPKGGLTRDFFACWVGGGG